MLPFDAAFTLPSIPRSAGPDGLVLSLAWTDDQGLEVVWVMPVDNVGDADCT
jgi:hypothetical protein